MGVRERVQQAIESSTAEAGKILDEAQHAGEYERLSILLNGWFRGVAAALEELAVELDGLRNLITQSDTRPAATAPAGSLETPLAKAAAEPLTSERSSELPDEAALAEQARASRAETEAVRAQQPDTSRPAEASSAPPNDADPA